MRLKTLIAIIFAFFSLNLNAEFYSGSKLFGMLKNDMTNKASYEGALATGFIVGVFDSNYSAKMFFCPPENVTVLQVKQIVFNFMQSNPQHWNSTAESNVLFALMDIWPCKSN